MVSFYTNGQRIYLLSFSIFLIVFSHFFTSQTGDDDTVNKCIILRGIDPRPKIWIPLSDSHVHNYSVYLMWALLFGMVFALPIKARGLYDLFYGSLWFHATYWCLYTIKALLGDTNCVGKHYGYPNGVSGHYCYFTYCLLSIPFFVAQRMRATNFARENNVGKCSECTERTVLRVMTAGHAVYMIGAVTTLYRTYYHGYHSAKQILYGSALGITSHLTLEILVSFRSDQVLFVKADIVRELAVLAVFVTVTFTSTWVYWPRAKVGKAIGSFQISGHLGSWLVLFLASTTGLRKQNERSFANVISNNSTDNIVSNSRREKID